MLCWFQKVTSEPLERFDFVELQGRSYRFPYSAQNNFTPQGCFCGSPYRIWKKLDYP